MPSEEEKAHNKDSASNMIPIITTKDSPSSKGVSLLSFPKLQSILSNHKNQPLAEEGKSSHEDRKGLMCTNYCYFCNLRRLRIINAIAMLLLVQH